MASNALGVETLKLINENFGGIYMFSFQPVHIPLNITAIHTKQPSFLVIFQQTKGLG